MARDSDEAVRLEMIQQLLMQYRDALPSDQPAWREVISKVYAHALRDTHNISDVTLKVEFADLRRIASSGDVETNAMAAVHAISEPVIEALQQSGKSDENKASHPALDLPLSLSVNVVDLVENPGRNIERTQKAAAMVGGMIKNAWEFSARELGFPTDEERQRLAEIYDLPYEKRLQALHSEILMDTATMVNMGSAPGLFVKQGAAIKESLKATGTALADIEQFPLQHVRPLPVLAGVSAESNTSAIPPSLMANKTANVPSAASRDLASDAKIAGSQHSILNLPVAVSNRLEHITLTALSIKQGGETIHHIPVTMHISPENRIDPATGQQRDWDGLGEALLPLLSDRTKPENLTHKLNAIHHIEIYFSGEAKLGDSYRSANRRLGDERITVVVHGHNPQYKNIDQATMVASIYPNANIRRPGDMYFNPQQPDQQLTVTYGSRYNLANGLNVLQEESSRLNALRDNLRQFQQTAADSKRLQYLVAQADLQVEIIKNIQESTKGYPEGIKKGGLKNPAQNVQLSIKSTDAGRHSGVSSVNADISRNNPGVFSANMTTVLLGTHGNIPVTLTYPGTMDAPDYQKLAVSANGLDLVHPGTAINTLSGERLKREIVDFVHTQGGTGHGADRSMKPAARESIEAIHLIYVGARNAKDIDHIGVNRYGITVSDDRFLIVAEMKGFDGKPIQPLTLKGNLHQPGTYMYDRLLNSNQISTESTPYFLTGGRHSVSKIKEALQAELDVLSKNAEFYRGGDVSRPRHEADFKPPSPNRSQQVLHEWRYAEIAAALNTFLEISQRYQTVDVVRAGEINRIPSVQSTHGNQPPENVPQHAQDFIAQRIQSNLARQLLESQQDIER